MRRGPVLAVAGALALAACGSRQTLVPPPGRTLPPAPLAAPHPPTAEELLTPGPQARPARNDELLQQSTPRTPDRFDLPPPGRP